MSSKVSVVHSRRLAPGESGELLNFSRESLGWQWMSMTAMRLNPNETYEAKTHGEEAAFVILGGLSTVNWGHGQQTIGGRKNVFDGLPYCLYLPSGNRVTFRAETVCEIAECRVPSKAQLEPHLVTPKDIASSIRGGGNASRQIVDIIQTGFPADKIVVI